MGLISRVSSRTYRATFKMSRTQPPVDPETGYVHPRNEYIASLKPQDIDIGYMDIILCDLIPKGPNSPVKKHVVENWGRRKSAHTPRDDFSASCKEAGRLDFMLFTKDVPKTVENFKSLLREKDGTGYSSTNFH